MSLTVEQIARVCHEANRAYAMILGDHSIPSWDVAPDWQKQSAIEGVKLALADPSLTPEKSHEAWVAHKKATGWTRGDVKRPEVLEHPLLVPYAELADEHRLKDALFMGIVRAVAPVSDAELVKAIELHEAVEAPQEALPEPMAAPEPMEDAEKTPPRGFRKARK